MNHSIVRFIEFMGSTFSVINLIMTVLMLVGMWKVFVKAGEKGWKAIIPLYNYHVLYKICWKPIFFWLGSLAGIVGIVLYFMSGGKFGILIILYTIAMLISLVLVIKAWVKLAKAFGHGVGFAIGLLLLTGIFLMILGFDGSEYQPEVRNQ
ncbi:MAG: DUF5684 domain-containing protein [bacterium]|nr:DUF5684 domain-containing protein [bacterium]